MHNNISYVDESCLIADILFVILPMQIITSFHVDLVEQCTGCSRKNSTKFAV